MVILFWVVLVLFSFLFFTLTVSRWLKVDAAHDLRAEQFGSHAMEIIPQNAIVFADGDQAIFALWYFHFALKQRPDIAILVPDLLQADWYVKTIRSNSTNSRNTPPSQSSSRPACR